MLDPAAQAKCSGYGKYDLQPAKRHGVARLGLQNAINQRYEEEHRRCGQSIWWRLMSRQKCEEAARQSQHE